MRNHYTGPNTAFYRCQETRSRLWWEAYQNLESVHHQAVDAFTNRHKTLLGEHGHLTYVTVRGHYILAPTRPTGCRPSNYQINIPSTAHPTWVPDRRTRTGRMLAAQIAGLPRFDPQMIEAAAPMPGNMPWIHTDTTGTMLHFRVVVDGVLHINWPQPIPDLDPAVWTPITAGEYLQAEAEHEHRERVRGLRFIHNRLTHHGTGDPKMLTQLAEAVSLVLDKHHTDHTRVKTTSSMVLRAERMLKDHHHMGQPGADQVHTQVNAALHAAGK